MKHLLTSLAVACAAIATVHAEAPYYSFQPGSESGSGFYVGAQGGFNLCQDTDRFTIDGIKVSSSSNVGGFGGLKVGYVGGAALDAVRPALELDGFYNGFSQDAKFKYLGFSGNLGKVDVDSEAFLINGVARFTLGSFQPYIGAGVGIYSAKYSTVLLGYHDSTKQTDFAWQLIAGVDYFVAPNISIFTEYKFLNYQDSGDRTGQQLLGGGLRFHF